MHVHYISSTVYVGSHPYRVAYTRRMCPMSRTGRRLGHKNERPSCGVGTSPKVLTVQYQGLNVANRLI